MKTYRFIIALSAALVAVSCAKEAGKELPAPEDPQDLITITASMGDGEAVTRAGARMGFSWFWSEGDKLTVIGTDGDPKVFNIKSGFSAQRAEFVGKPVDGDKFTILFPNDKAASADWSKQTQTGNGSTAHLAYAASLADVDDYINFAFSPAWATEHGGTLQQTGVLKFDIALPASVTTVTGLSIMADTPLFYSGNGEAMTNKLALTLTDAAPDEDHHLTAWMTTSWREATVPAGTTLVVAIIGDKNLEREVTFAKEAVLMSGMVNTFTLNDQEWAEPSHYSAGKGTEASPWVIKTPVELQYMKDDLIAGGIRYFKLGADIDMTGIDWEPLNAASPYDKQIDFDGDGHTISNFTCSAASYPSFFGVLYGKCHNVKFVNATVNASAKGCGILGGYGGTTDKPCEVNKVHVQGTLTSSAGSNAGGFFGTARECTITASSADVVISTKGQLVGGLIGADAGLGVTIRDCWTSGSVVTESSIAGGICGDLIATGSSIINCYSTSTVTTQFIYGGIVGRAVAGQKSNKTNCTNQDPKNHIEYCIAWNDKLSSDFVPDTAEHYGSAAVVGQTAFKNYLVGCVRKAGMDFSVCAANVAAGGYDPFDQEDASPENPMTPGTGNYAFGYHGKASAAGETLSQVAQRIGWSAEVWDFSGEKPVLK